MSWWRRSLRQARERVVDIVAARQRPAEPREQRIDRGPQVLGDVDGEELDNGLGGASLGAHAVANGHVRAVDAELDCARLRHLDAHRPIHRRARCRTIKDEHTPLLQPGPQRVYETRLADLGLGLPGRNEHARASGRG